ncbi:MAG: M28 family peptidase [Thermoleophilaceae bacterium]
MTPSALDPLDEIEDLVAFEARAPGTDAERRAAGDLAHRLRTMGRDAEIEPFWTWPRLAPTCLLHVVVGVVGSVTSVFDPVVGIAIVLLALVALVLDLTGRAHLARRLTPRRASQNVVSREDGEKPGTLVLVAHYDAGPATGPLASGALRRLTALSRVLRLALGPTQVLTGLLVTVAILAGLRIAFPNSYALNVVQVVPTVLLVLAAAILVGITVAPISPGANRNAAGVATALQLAGSHGASLAHFDLWVLLSGADEGGLLGTAAFVRAHRRHLDRRRTVFVGLDRTGVGTVRYARREGLLRRRRYYGPVLERCDELAAGDAQGERFGGARSIAPPTATSAHAAARRGYPAVAISCAPAHGDAATTSADAGDTPDHLDLAALDRAFAFGSALIESIDAELGPAVADLPEAAPRSRWRVPRWTAR